MKSNRFLCFLFFGLLVFPVCLIFLCPTEDFSPTENRMLATFPAWDARSFFDGSYAEGIGDFLADRMPLRETLLRVKSASELLAGRRQNGNVFFGKDMYQIKRLEECDLEMLRQNKQAAESIAAHLEKSGKPVTVLYAPRAIDVLGDKLPSGYPQSAAEKPWTVLPRSPLFSVLKEKAARGESVWYRTDHHWTALGAYYAYEFLGDSLGYTPLPQNAFRVETVKEDFFGTSASASLFPLARPDTIVRYRFEGDTDFTVVDLSTGKERRGFYDDEKLSTADAYAAFLGGNFAHLRITKDGSEGRPLLLIIKDSYANCLVPFLARHFDIEMLDPRYIRGASYEIPDGITAKENYAGALLLWNAETLCSDAGLLPFLSE